MCARLERCMFVIKLTVTSGLRRIAARKSEQIQHDEQFVNCAVLKSKD
jgi:hypothetical protein